MRTWNNMVSCDKNKVNTGFYYFYLQNFAIDILCSNFSLCGYYSASLWKPPICQWNWLLNLHERHYDTWCQYLGPVILLWVHSMVNSLDTKFNHLMAGLSIAIKHILANGYLAYLSLMSHPSITYNGAEVAIGSSWSAFKVWIVDG